MDDLRSESLESIDVSPDISIENVMPGPRRKVVRWYHSVGDFFNCLKAFIGTNYQALPFAFSNSGLALGILGVFLIAALNDHCIQLLIRCKNLVISRICREQVEAGDIEPDEENRLASRLQSSISYGDLGRRALGDKAYHVIMAAIWFTQYMTIISYYIFIGNTVREIFPMVPRPIVIQNGTTPNESIYYTGFLRESDRHGHGIPMLHISNIGHPIDKYLEYRNDVSERFIRAAGDQDLYAAVQDGKFLVSSSLDTHLYSALSSTRTENQELTADLSSQSAKKSSETDTFTESNSAGSNTKQSAMSMDLELSILPDSTESSHSSITAVTMTAVTPNTTTPRPPPSSTVKPVINMISSAPDLRLIMLFPLPFFILTSLIRKIRYLAPFTSIATAALAAGAFSVLGFIITYFQISDDFSWWKLQSLPLFLGQLIGAYEGIGCVIPIQSSMDGNRHLFPCFIHSAVTIVFLVLCSFGILGYLSYGDGVAQIIITNIPQHSLLAILVDVTLIISVLFTYPLQCYPVIEILEIYLFSPGKCCGPRQQRLEYDRISSDIGDHSLIQERSIEISADRVSSVIPPTVAAWKRNVLRIMLTLISVGVAVALKDAYAYLSAFTGAVGASLLSLIFPCLIHLALKWNNLSMANRIKDYSIIAFAGVSSILTLVVIIWKMVKSVG